jgi:uncharacterized protein
MPNAWLHAFLGGALIGGSALLLLLFLGRIAGVSGITTAAITERGEGRRWRLSFLAGLLAGGAALKFARPEVFGISPVGLYPLTAAGLLVGFGVSLGSGCTSGHGVCGVSRLSPRSIAAVLTFMLVGMAAASLFHGGIRP